MAQPFKYYLHDGYTRFEARESLEEQGIVLSDEAWEKMGRPFYEVTLECEVDDNGTVRVLGTKL